MAAAAQRQGQQGIAVRSGNRRNGVQRAGASPAKIRERQTIRTLMWGGLSSLSFGFIQRNVKLPGIPGVPNSLTYGTGALAVGLLANSPTLVQIGTGPFFAGLHNLGHKGIGQDVVGGEYDETAGEFDNVAGEFDNVAGEFDSPDSTAGYETEDVTAGDFDDL